MFDSDLFRIGDKVFYAGEKYQDRLNGKPGWIHAAVSNQPGVWVVEFPGTHSKEEDDTDDYVLSSRVLTKRATSAPKKEDNYPEVQPRRHRKNEDE